MHPLRQHSMALACGALLVIAPYRVSAQQPEASAILQGPEAIPTSFPINDEDPESTVPSEQQAMRDPLQMGYLMMAFADRAEAAEKAGNLSKAAKYYRAMAKAVPDRAIGFRKACRAHDGAGEAEKAVDMCRRALGTGGVTQADHLAFLQVMLKRPGAFSATDVEDMDAVLQRLQDELGLGKDDKGRRMLADLNCQIGTRLSAAARLETCVKELRALKVEETKLFGYTWALAISQDDISRAADIAEEAKQAGLPAASIEVMERGIRLARESGAGSSRLDGARRWWPVALAGLLALVPLAALRLRRRSRLNPA